MKSKMHKFLDSHGIHIFIPEILGLAYCHNDIIRCSLEWNRTLVAQLVENPPAMQEIWV